MTSTKESDRLWRYARAMAAADDEDMYEWEREYGRRARAAMKIADEEIAEALTQSVASGGETLTTGAASSRP